MADLEQIKLPNNNIYNLVDISVRNIIANTYDSSYPSYSVGDLCSYEGVNYICISPTTGGNFDQSCWDVFTYIELSMWGGSLPALTYGYEPENTYMSWPATWFYNTNETGSVYVQYSSIPSGVIIVDNIHGTTAPEYIEYTYKPGDIVIYDGKLYVCLENTGGIFDPECWILTTDTIFDTLKRTDAENGVLYHLGLYLDENGGLCQVNSM